MRLEAKCLGMTRVREMTLNLEEPGKAPGKR